MNLDQDLIYYILIYAKSKDGFVTLIRTLYHLDLKIQ